MSICPWYHQMTKEAFDLWKSRIFYENIAQGAESLHIPVEEALKSLKEKGMTRVYLCDRTFYEVKDDLMPVLKGLGIAIEGFFSLAIMDMRRTVSRIRI